MKTILMDLALVVCLAGCTKKCATVKYQHPDGTKTETSKCFSIITSSTAASDCFLWLTNQKQEDIIDFVVEEN